MKINRKLCRTASDRMSWDLFTFPNTQKNG